MLKLFGGFFYCNVVVLFIDYKYLVIMLYGVLFFEELKIFNCIEDLRFLYNFEEIIFFYGDFF